MARQNPHQSFGKILALVFGVAFGVIGLIMVYKAVQDSTENRSKAAEEQVTYKQWEFNGKDTEGWKVPVGSTVRSGYLHLPAIYQMGLLNSDGSTKQYVLSIDNTAVNTVFPVGNKQIKFMIAVGGPPRYDEAINANPPVSTTVVGESSFGSGPGGPAPSVITGITYEEQQKNNVKYPQYTMTVSYTTRENTQKYIQIPSVTGMADSQFREMTITIPNSINEMRMGALNVQFTNVSPESEVQIDWIRLVGPKGNIIPSCKGDAVKSVTIENRCAGLKAKNASYQCADGFTGSVGDGNTCVSGNTLRLQAQKVCARHRSCPIPPTPTPPQGCRYEPRPCADQPGDVWGLQENCGMELVCPTTTIVPISTTLCQPRPSCLDNPPFCYLAVPAEGWCVQ